jgi:hypothetical protein
MKSRRTRFCCVAAGHQRHGRKGMKDMVRRTAGLQGQGSSEAFPVEYNPNHESVAGEYSG